MLNPYIVERYCYKVLIVLLLFTPVQSAGEGKVIDYAREARHFLSFFTAEQQSVLLIPVAQKQKSADGIDLIDLSQPQTEAFKQLLLSILRKQGFKKFKSMLDACRAPDKYYLAFYGNPVTDSLWSWQIDGPLVHLYCSVNDSGYLSVTPSCWIEEKGISGVKEQALLFYEEAFAFELLKSLESYKKYEAVMSPLVPEGIANSEIWLQQSDGLLLREMNWDQMILFIRLINSHLGNFKREIARRYWDQIIDHDFKQLRFAWYGSLSADRSFAYVIHGPSITICYHKSPDRTYVYMKSN